MKNELVRTSVPDVPIHISEYVHTSSGRKPISDIHYHDEIELLSITSGTIAFTVNGRTYTAKAGEVVFFNSRIPHCTTRNGCPCTYILLQFKPETFMHDENRPASKYFYRFVNAYDTPFKIISNETLSVTMNSILGEYNTRKDGWSLYIRSGVYALIATLVREKLLAGETSINRTDIEKILPALNYIDENYGKEISLKEISAVQGLNESYFCRLFKRASGSSFTDYLNFVRICKSEKLLAKTNAGITEISYDVGFSSVSYFNRVFKKLKNCTPSAYRKAQYTHI